MVEVKNGNFVINGRDTFLFGGEIHYFRVPRQDWENRIIRAKQAGANLVSSYIPWLIHEYEEGDIDLEGRRRPENDLGAFLQLIKKHHMYCILRPGPYIMTGFILLIPSPWPKIGRERIIRPAAFICWMRII